MANLGEGAAMKQAAYMVDMEKSYALDLLGETRHACVAVYRHI